MHTAGGLCDAAIMLGVVEENQAAYRFWQNLGSSWCARPNAYIRQEDSKGLHNATRPAIREFWSKIIYCITVNILHYSLYAR